jgi:hypothetical protein
MDTNTLENDFKKYLEIEKSKRNKLQVFWQDNETLQEIKKFIIFGKMIMIGYSFEIWILGLKYFYFQIGIERHKIFIDLWLISFIYDLYDKDDTDKFKTIKIGIERTNQVFKITFLIWQIYISRWGCGFQTFKK